MKERKEEETNYMKVMAFVVLSQILLSTIKALFLLGPEPKNYKHKNI